MSSLDRMLSLLDAFTSERPVWSKDELAERAGGSRSTSYRYVRSLQSAGLLSPVGNDSWVLGPRILELDLQLRKSDPLYVAAGPSLIALVERTGFTALVCTLFSDAVICIRDERGPHAPSELFSRGQRRPFFTAAASKIMLPYLRPHQLRRLFSNNKKAIADSGLGKDWKTFLAELRQIRSQGYCFTRGEFRPGVVGFAAPIVGEEGTAVASLGVAIPENKFRKKDSDLIISLVKAEADRLAIRMRKSGWTDDLKARGVGRMRA